MKTPLRNQLYRWLLTWLVCFAISQGLGVLLHIENHWWISAPALLLWCCVLAMAERFGRFWAVLALWVVGIGLCVLLSDRGLLAEAALSAVSRKGTDNSYGELILLMLCATAALPLSALLRYFWVRVVLSLCWIGLWIAAAIAEWTVPRTIPAAMIPILLLTLAEAVSRFRGDPVPGETLKRALLLALLPAAVVLAVLPAPSEPYGYPLLHTVADKVEDLLHDVETYLHYRSSGEQQYGISFNGISDDADLGEGGEENNRGIIYAKPDKTPDGSLYIFGNAWDHFDGRGWSSTLKQETAEQLRWGLDTAEHLYALWRMLGPDGCKALSTDYFRKNSVYLDLREMNVRTMFSVMNAMNIFTDTERFPYGNAPTGTLFKYVQQDEAWYRIYYLEPNARTHGSFIKAAEGTVYDSKAHAPLWKTVAEAFGDNVYELDIWDGMNLEKTLAERTELIQRVYLDSSAVSDRARALAESITRDCGSDYEKLKAIAAYLHENYIYTLRPEPVPEGEDFLDWLLFEGQEGYCTWYATAAVLLARSVGVPSRYVQGYRAELPGGMFTQLGPEYSHAWCEGYITGYGWVTIEPTPGFGASGEGWMTAAEKSEAGIIEPGGVIDPEDELIPLKPVESEEDQTQHIPGTPADEPEEIVPEAEPVPARHGWLLALIPAALLAALVAVLLRRRTRRKLNYEDADPSVKLRLDLEALLRDLRGKGYPRKPEESMKQYFERLPWHFLLASETEAGEMAELYDRTFFGGKTPSNDEIARHKDFAARFRPRTLRQWIVWYSLQ